jgi:hypothetical protein
MILGNFRKPCYHISTFKDLHELKRTKDFFYASFYQNISPRGLGTPGG